MSQASKVELEDLLSECLDWICEHKDAIEMIGQNPDSRAWCVDCHNYLRTSADATLKDRIRKALGICEPTVSGAV